MQRDKECFCKGRGYIVKSHDVVCRGIYDFELERLPCPDCATPPASVPPAREVRSSKWYRGHPIVPVCKGSELQWHCTNSSLCKNYWSHQAFFKTAGGEGWCQAAYDALVGEAKAVVE